MNKHISLISIGLVAGLALGIAACSDDDETPATPATGGTSASGGTAGSGGSTGGTAGSGGSTGGTAGSGGSTGGTAGSGGSAGSAGSAGMAGAGGMGGAMPRGMGNPPTLGAQIDRSGRPAVSTALQATFEPTGMAKDMAKDSYNTAPPSMWTSFKPAFEKSLGILDSLDENCGNQLLAGNMAVAGRYGALADVLLDDQLYVNTAKNTGGVYLGVEAEFLAVVTDGGDGGRRPADDIIDRSYSVFALGALTGFDDTIIADDATPTSTFPFLAAP